MSLLKRFYLSVTLLAVACLFTPSYAKILMTPETPMVFTDKDIVVFEDPTQQTTVQDVYNQQYNFVKPEQIKHLKSNVTYWALLKIESKLDHDRFIQIDASGWKRLTPTLIYSDGQIRTLKSVGFVGSYNPFLDNSPLKTSISKFDSGFPKFLLKSGAEVTLLIQLNSHPFFNTRSFSLNLIDDVTFAEFRRFSLYIEGALVGTLFALTVFALFNAYQTRDRVNSFYALWISVAFLSVFASWIYDGYRLFEFFNIESKSPTNTDSVAFIIFAAVSYSQAITYTLFARQYLNIKQYYPKLYVLTTIWVAYAVVYCLLMLTGSFYFLENHIDLQKFFALPYALSVGFLLITFFVCSYLRYREGFVFSIYFTYAIIPYLVFRLSFVFGTYGFPTIFQFLPDQGLGYFLKNPWTNLAFGICMEALIMALAVISRARWLQLELNRSSKQQTTLVEQQNTLLEIKVEERTQELRQKQEIVESSMNYASRLQRGQLPRAARLENRFNSFATIWEPRDTIGGDLYWISSSQHQGPFVLVVADCTGHGVPGAMLSLLVSNSLERIFAKSTIDEPTKALTSLDYFIRSGLNQDLNDSESNDGCDAAMVRIHQDKKLLEYAGAKIDLFHVDSRGELHRYRSNRVSLGYKDQDTEPLVPTREIHYESGDLFMIVTDGLTDQIGGNNQDRPVSFGYRRLSSVISANKDKDCQVIADEVRTSFIDWQGSHTRRDDVTVVLFKP
ncbi:MAG: SpoIIE family protein phosphatase [Leptolyngbyaceae bacterium]|nr:SpoIIE family protein phosphatase [Leptolyngbyaceae bacterium]